MGDAIKTTLGRHFLATLGDKTDIDREDFQRDGDNLRGIPHLKIELRAD